MTKKVLIFGNGQQGSLIAQDLLNYGYDVTVADKAQKDTNAKFLCLDITKDFVPISDGYDLIISALPASLGPLCVALAVSKGINCVDLSFTETDLHEKFDRISKINGCTVLADCGLAPGLPNLIIGDAISRYGTLESAKIYVGGVADDEFINDLGYVPTWSISDLCSEYTRKSRVVINHREIELPEPLYQYASDLEHVGFKNAGLVLEAFPSDGVRSLIRYKYKIRNIIEKTLRYPSHLAQIQLLSGVSDNNFEFSKLEKTFSSLPFGDDLVALKVNIVQYGQQESFELVEYGTPKLSAMSKTTAYSCAAFARALLEGKVTQNGVIYPEDLGELGLLDYIFAELKQHSIFINKY